MVQFLEIGEKIDKDVLFAQLNNICLPVWLPFYMSAYLYDIYLFYDDCLPIRCPPTCIIFAYFFMFAQLY
jgi:hypothetical protein